MNSHTTQPVNNNHFCFSFRGIPHLRGVGVLHGDTKPNTLQRIRIKISFWCGVVPKGTCCNDKALHIAHCTGLRY